MDEIALEGVELEGEPPLKAGEPDEQSSVERCPVEAQLLPSKAPDKKNDESLNARVNQTREVYGVRTPDVGAGGLYHQL
jgi:hypothetical protein